MEWLKRLAARVWKKGGEAPAPAQQAQAPRGQGPVERILPCGEPQWTEQAARVRAEEVAYSVARAQELSAQGTRVQRTEAENPLERLALMGRRCACDIAAQEDLI